MIDWQAFLTEHGIPYVTHGANVSKGNIAVRCPFCGSDDPSEHMSISLSGQGWSCWRNPRDHSGKNPVRLIRALTGCSVGEAIRLAGGTSYLPGDFMGKVNAHIGQQEDYTAPPRRLRLLKDFRELDKSVRARPYINYLITRGFTVGSIKTMTEDYDLHFCPRGPFRKRIIFPVYEEGRLVSWTGRSISRSAYLRYKALSTDFDAARAANLPMAIGPITDYLLWFDDLMEIDCDTIIISEGPIDALKLNVLGWDYGVCATCLFTANMTARQADLLHLLLPRFRRKLILLDQGMLATSMRLANELSALGVGVGILPPRFEDPGVLTESALLDVLA